MKSIDEFMFGEDGLRALMAEQDYLGALELLQQEAHNYPDFARMFTFDKVLLSAWLEDSAQTLLTLQQALDNGDYFPRMAFEPYVEPPIPGSISALPRFQALLEAHAHGWQRLIDSAKPVHFTAAPDGIENPPLLIGFHGNTSSIALEFEYYEPLIALGYQVVMPQSAQPWARDRYVWGDWPNTEKQIQREWQRIGEMYSFSEEGIITAGLSKGGEVAVWSAVSGVIPAAGVIGLDIGGPLVDDPTRLQPFVAEAKQRNIAFYFLLGADDSFTAHSTQATAAYLSEQGFRVALKVVEGLGHEFPKDLAGFWSEALAFIRN